VFTHNDLHPRNIIVSSEENPRLLAITDRHKNGWYPAYWEYFKARWPCQIGEEREAEYVPLILAKEACCTFVYGFVLKLGV
jgi:hypothetical protein